MAGLTVDPDHLCSLAGAGSVIDLLFHCIAAAGEGALIPVPYYPAFDNDLQVGAGWAGWVGGASGWG
jgi:1-aminocyclopropane-1-carboxylate synthase